MIDMIRRNPEILAPAGSIETLYAAVAMGADAVYVGAPRYGARAFAKNPSIEELQKAIVDLHLRGKKLYLTTNTLMRDEEIGASGEASISVAKEETLIGMLEPLIEVGLDACIVQDPGVLIALHDAFPTLNLHASTQMALFSGEEAELLRRYGVTRFVPARELTIDEIRAARTQTDMEIEVFVHGALCVCYSGWCLMSEHIGGRSGNRGMCAGPCRLPYERKTILSSGTGSVHAGKDSTRRLSGSELAAPYSLNAKDQETLLHIPELIEAGIDSFKIEGRMKSREYASYIAYLYRHYADIYLSEGGDRYRELIEDKDSVLWRDRKRAMELYNRGGFYSSFLFASDDEPTIEKRVKGHYGLPVGEVAQVMLQTSDESDHGGKSKSRKNSSDKNRDNDRSKKGSSVKIRFTESVSPGDVIAIRDDAGETVYEFTVGRGLSGSKSYKSNLKDGGFLDGSRHDNNSRKSEMLINIGYSDVNKGYRVFRTKNASLLADIDDRIDKAISDDVVKLQGRWVGKIGEPVRLVVTGTVPVDTVYVVRDINGSDVADSLVAQENGGRTIKATVEGDTVQAAAKRPVTADDVRDRLSSLGGSGYVWESLDIEMDDGAFIPLKSVKELRRKAISAFETESVRVLRESAVACSAGAKADKTVADIDTYKPDGSDTDKIGETDQVRDDSKIGELLSGVVTWIAVQTMGQLEEVLIFLKKNHHIKTVLHVKLGGFSVLLLDKIHTMWKSSQKELSDVVWAFSLPRAWRGKLKSENEDRMVDFFSYFVGGSGMHTAEQDECDISSNMEDGSDEQPFIFVANSMASIVFRDKYLPEDTLTVADENLYMWNDRAEHFYKRMGIYPGPIRSYGRVPVMTTAHEIEEGEIITPKGDRFIVVKQDGSDGRSIYTAEPVREVTTDP
ncbi:MAG: U32 family peptidase, partial [Eubacterium sp.]|nr:U32 family peptidase [Eubacterium sp.]